MQLQLHRWRGEGGVCTWLVLRVPRQYISTQTGLLGEAQRPYGGLNQRSSLVLQSRETRAVAVVRLGQPASTPE